ncbi:hypothetical protein H6F43_16180, partial [Leptolyngbya sp. FACHB-36]|nr:hypothetical protein [Leptolyngbya sp. FACHB-36]
PAAQLPADGSGFKITLSRAGSTAVGSNRCIIIQTLLGATRAAEGNDCQVAPTP